MTKPISSLLILVSTFSVIIANNKDSPLIIGGRDATPGEFPYQISLQHGYNDDNFQHTCGGSILSETWILTAGHCYESARSGSWRIVAGDLKCYGYHHGRQTRIVKKFIVHPKYSSDSAKNDIALLQLEHPLEFTGLVQAIQLPEAGSVPEGQGIVTGWGTTKRHNITSNFNLQTLTVPIYSQSECAKYFPMHNKNKEFCAGHLYKGACFGDSGGPLAQNGQIIGIVSYGSWKCASGAPTVFTKVSSYIDFIEKHAFVKNSN